MLLPNPNPNLNPNTEGMLLPNRDANHELWHTPLNELKACFYLTGTAAAICTVPVFNP
jgi:hypothetical protein